MRNLLRASTIAMTAAISFICVFLAGCKPQPMQSGWLTSVSTATGDPDWWNLPAYRLEKLDGTITIVNDSSALYVRFYSRDQRLMRRLRGSGLTVWLTNAQNKSERLGIHYPLGMHGRGRPPEETHMLPNADLPPEVVMNMLDRPNNENLEILQSDSAAPLMKTPEDARLDGIRALVSEPTAGGVQYALQITPGEGRSWIKPGAKLLLEINSPAMGRGDSEGKGPSEHGGWGGRHGGGGGEGGEGGGGGGFGHRGGHRGGGGESGDDHDSKQPAGVSPTTPLHFQFAIQMASRPQPESAAAK
jgi:uncharacterized membrane protein YgcG